jgi:hypothetical protein
VTPQDCCVTGRPLIARHHLKLQLIACAIETYGAFGTEFTKMIKTIAGTIDKASDCFRPWHAATFEQDAYQRIGIALQRGIISDQLARAHAVSVPRRVLGAPPRSYSRYYQDI